MRLRGGMVNDDDNEDDVIGAKEGKSGMKIGVIILLILQVMNRDKNKYKMKLIG